MSGSETAHPVFSSVVDLILDIVLPSTDLGVLAQTLAAFVVFVLALWRFWRSPDARLLTIGFGLVLFGFFGFRALH